MRPAMSSMLFRICLRLIKPSTLSGRTFTIAKVIEIVLLCRSHALLAGRFLPMRPALNSNAYLIKFVAKFDHELVVLFQYVRLIESFVQCLVIMVRTHRSLKRSTVSVKIITSVLPVLVDSFITCLLLKSSSLTRFCFHVQRSAFPAFPGRFAHSPLLFVKCSPYAHILRCGNNAIAKACCASL